MWRIEAEWSGRENFALLMTWYGINEAIEIGTDRGTYARALLERWPGYLWCVDPYESYPHMPWDRTADFMMAASQLALFGDRARIVRMTGRAFAEAREDIARRVGLIYIDGDHEEAAVRDDLAVWWPRLKYGGILAGHDIDNAPGVNAALESFSEETGLVIQVVHDPDARSWYVRKPEIL